MSDREFSVRALDAALERGDGLDAWSAAAEIRPVVGLDCALALVLVVVDDHVRFDRACARWLARWEVERPGRARSDDGRRIADALGRLPDMGAITVLGEICGRLGFATADRTLVHLLPDGRAGRPRGPGSA